MDKFLFDLLKADSSEISWWAMVLRCIIVFAIAIIYIKIGGKRIFSKYGAFDIVVSIMLGTILAKSIVGNAKFIPALLTCLVMVLLHRLLGKLALSNHQFGNFIKGNIIPLSKDGVLLKDEMYKNEISEQDILEAMREQINSQDMSKVKDVYLERDGKMSVLVSEKD